MTDNQLALFDYGTLDPESRIVVQQEDKEFDRNMAEAGTSFIHACHNLRRIHQALRYKRPGFVDYCNSKQGLSIRTADKMVAVAEMFAESANILTAGKEALYLLASPSTPDTAREEALERAEAGEAITHATAKAIVEEHRQEAYPAQRPDPAPQPVLAIVEAEEAPTENRPLVPHVAQATGDQEWYTPAEYIEAARFVMGEIDCDPATSEIAQQTVKASIYYTAETNGLRHNWPGRIWMNPPYAAGLVDAFTGKLAEQVQAGWTKEAIVLVNNATETRWFGSLVRVASAIVFPGGRVRFIGPDGAKGAPLQGQAVVYIGENVDEFLSVFGAFGWGCRIERV